MTGPKTLEQLKAEWDAAEDAYDAAYDAYREAETAYYKALEAQEKTDD